MRALKSYKIFLNGCLLVYTNYYNYVSFHHCRSIEILLGCRVKEVRKDFMEEVAFMLGLEVGIEC